MLKPHVAVFGADHGVTAEGVSAYPADVTGAMVAAMVAMGMDVGMDVVHAVDVVVDVAARRVKSRPQRAGCPVS